VFVYSLLFAFGLHSPLAADKDTQPVVIPAKKHPGGNAEAVAVSADGKYVAAGFGGPTSGRFPLKPKGGGVFVWDRKTGQQVFARGEFGDIIKVGFSRDGRYLAYGRVYTPGDSVEANNTVLIDLESKKVVKRWRDAAFAFSPVDSRLVVGGSRGTEVFSLKTLKTERTVNVRGARALAFSADGKTVAALCYFWSGRVGKPTGLAVFSPDRDRPHFSVNDQSLRSANAVAVSPDGKQVVSGHTKGVARIWNAQKPAKPRTLSMDTSLSVFPLFADRGETLLLATQPANGTRWSYDRGKPSGFKFKKETTPPWSDLHWLELASGKRKQTWRFEDASFRTIYARFGSGRHYPEYNPAKWALAKDGTFLVAGCNGCCIVDAKSAKVIGTFVRGQPDGR
jgi:WD40 repeat protein